MNITGCTAPRTDQSSDFESVTDAPSNEIYVNTTMVAPQNDSQNNTVKKRTQTSSDNKDEIHQKFDVKLEQTLTDDNTFKIYAPVMAHEVIIPTKDKKESMAIIPIPDSQSSLGVPIETLSKFLNTQISKTVRDEQHARDLLLWNDGIGTLDGCDLRFKINQLGCLELLDSDDESENQNQLTVRKDLTSNNATQTSRGKSNNNIEYSKFKNNNDNINNKKNINYKSTSTSTTPTFKTKTTTNEAIDLANSNQKKIKLDVGGANTVRQISPGSSLLRDGPNTRRPKTTSQAALMKKIENNQNTMLMEKLIPKQKLEKIKGEVTSWTIDEVKDFVDSIPGCSGYGESFRTQEICGKSFLYLDQRDLLDVINVKLGPAVKIYHAISLLKSL